MKLQVQSVKPKQPFTNDYGTMYPFTIMGLLDGDLDSVDMNFKSESGAPKVGETLDVEVTDGKYGKKAKKISTFGGTKSGAPASTPANNRSFALSYAKDIVVAQLAGKEKIEKPVSTTIQYADVLLKWLEGSIATVPEATKPGHQVFAERNADEFNDIQEYMDDEGKEWAEQLSLGLGEMVICVPTTHNGTFMKITWCGKNTMQR